MEVRKLCPMDIVQCPSSCCQTSMFHQTKSVTCVTFHLSDFKSHSSERPDVSAQGRKREKGRNYGHFPVVILLYMSESFTCFTSHVSDCKTNSSKISRDLSAKGRKELKKRGKAKQCLFSSAVFSNIRWMYEN